ncbi:MAG: epoxyqueuosine reductase [candidate division WOR-3 bacterium]|nr:MAG: epoxyqueuosine reductase [candidate division WOR-3 bacterium]
MNEIIEELQQKLTNTGFKSSVVSVRRLPDIRRDFENLIKEGILNKDFYDEIVSRYELRWNFEPAVSSPSAESVIITAVQQPKVSLEFENAGKKYYAVIPPTYIHETDQEVLDVMSPFLEKHGYKACAAVLPSKLLAVRSGLAQYGRNNITYIEDWGSYYRLRAFFSDMPCADDKWQEPVAMELCRKCTTCIKKCPTRAISQDRFLVNAGKCLTFFNEASYDFPEWLDPGWHNCIIGCMICQDVCPANKDHTAWIMPGGDFSEKETSMILDGVSKDKLPAEISEKLQKVNMLESYDLLQRNLGALIRKKQRSAGKGKKKK